MNPVANPSANRSGPKPTDPVYAYSTSRILAICGGFLVILLLVAFVIFTRIADQEPRIQGRLLGDWLDACGPQQSLSTRRAAQKALQSYGTNSLPHLVKLLGSKDYYFKTQWIQLANQYAWLSSRVQPAWVDHRRARHGFRILGPSAEPVIPDLIRLLADPQCGHGAVDALVRIGIASISPLASSLTNANAIVRVQSARALGRLNWEAEPAIDALMQALQDEDPHVRSEAIQSLAEIRERPRDVVPTFVRLLDDHHPVVRQNAAYCLGDFEAEAQSALGGLFKTLYDTNQNVRFAAFNALKKINPDTEDHAIEVLRKIRRSNAGH